jgi:hypothetical protein
VSLRGGARAGRERVSGVAKVVEAEALRHADDDTGPTPFPTEGAATEGRSLLPEEDQTTGSLAREQLHVNAQFSPQELRQEHGSGARFRLGVSGYTTAVRAFRLSESHRDLQRSDVDVPTAEAGQLFGTEGPVRTEEDHEAPARTELIRQRVDLRHGRDRPLGSLLLARALDPAWVAPDQLVINGGFHDALEQPVRLGGRGLCSSHLKTLGTPPAHARSGDLIKVVRLERRQDVVVQEVAVQVMGEDSQLSRSSTHLKLTAPDSGSRRSPIVSKVSGAGRMIPSGPGQRA